MTTNPKVAVIMSTYNGSRFIKEQINTILAQKKVDIKLYIRDDGSSDETIKIIRDFASGSIILTEGKNIGVGNSFMNALYSVSDEFDYYCFADQDDIWCDDKVISGVKLLESQRGPALYVSGQILTDAAGNRIGERRIPENSCGTMQIFSNNELTGCTMIWNKELHKILKESSRRPSAELLHKRIHDVWVAVIASLVGTIIADNTSHILYRQHENNVVGVFQGSMISTWKKKLYDKSIRNSRSLLAQELVQKYGDMLPEAEKEILTVCAGYKRSFLSRIKLLRNRELYQLSGEKPYLYRLKVLLGVF